MSVQKGQYFWESLLVKILKKKERGSLSRKKAHRKLLRKASKILGLPADNVELRRSADEFIAQARKNGHLLINDNTVSLPQGSQPQGQTSKHLPEELAEVPPTTNRGGAAGPSSTPPAQQPEAPQKAAKHKHANAADSNPGAKLGGQLTTAATSAPVKKKKQKKAPADAAASEQPAVQIGVPETAENAHASQPTDAANQQAPANQEPTNAVQGTKKKKKRKIPEAASDQPAHPSVEAATAAATPAAKRRKKVKEAAVEQAAPPEQDAAAAEPAAADHTAKKKKKKAKYQAAPGQATQAAPKESVEKRQAPAAAEGQKAGKADLPDASAILGGADTALSWRQDMKRKDVKHGRFSLSERETIKQAVKEYAQSKGLSETDLEWLYSTSKSTSEHKHKVRGAWKTIAQSLPHRTQKAVWCCGTRMLHEGNFKGKWTAEEEDKLKQLYAAKGGRWKEIGNSLGRLPEAVRDKYKSMKLGDARKEGKWTPEEEGKLAKLVQEYLDARPNAADSPVDGRVVLDDLPWDAISRRHGSRDQDQCRRKWFQQLSPSMVDRGDWGAGDDRRMLKALFRSGAANEWEVDWNALVPGRHAGLTKRRWRLMLKCVPDGADRDFADCIDFLVDAYTPDLKPAAAAANAPAEAA
ncbi:probable cyclin-D-binding Myb-like transcription factor 1 at C-terminar half [Coccomyxa sp. Obi]|nr:probable cyclin-D-binding Myb-like transcription factor 1 at C-terminar half [Coccomyxa sp. Obi]